MSESKMSKYYPAEDEHQLKKARKTANPTKYRASLTPGTILVLLSGRFRGKRVILLRQLSQGTLLITGPFKSNGVPLRRVNHRYVIATSTHIDISGVSSEILDRVGSDEYWSREKRDGGKGEEDLFTEDETTPAKKEVDPQRVEDQKMVDRAVLESVRKVPDLEGYLKSSFSLRGDEKPHEMVF